MFVKNSFRFDPRVEREATALVAAGHDVHVVAVRAPDLPVREHRHGVGVTRVRPARLGTSAAVVAGGVLSIAAEVRRVASGGRFDRARLRRGVGVGVGATHFEQAAADEPSSGGDRGDGALRAVVASALADPVRAARAVVLNLRMRRVGVADGADVYHAHDLDTLWVARSCSRRRSARLVYDSHELHTARARDSWRQRLSARVRERRWIRDVDAVIAASPGYAAELTRLYGTPVQVVRNVPTRTVIEPRSLRAALDIDDSARVLVYQGSIQEHRGIEQVVEAFDLLDDCVLVVIGYGHHREPLRRWVEERGLSSRVRFFGPFPQAEMLRWTASADVGMCTIVGVSRSYELSLPNKLFEYLAAGIPVVASSFGAMADLVIEEGVGEVCDPVDPAAIAAAVRRVLGDRARYREAAVSAGRRLTWEAEKSELLAVYTAVGG